MAYDKPLKIQWTEINGRPVPLVLPQYWSDEKNDWVVSSEQNRLPVDAQLTGRKVKVKIEQFNLDEPIAPNSSATLAVIPPEGKMWTVEGLRITTSDSPNNAGATEGIHFYNMYYDGYVYIARFSASYDERLYFRYSMLERGNIEESYPDDQISLWNAVKGIRFTSENYIKLDYWNETDAEITHNTNIRLAIYEEENG